MNEMRLGNILLELMIHWGMEEWTVIAQQQDRNKYRMPWEHAGGFLKIPEAEGEGREIGTNFPQKLMFCSGREISPNNF